MFDGILPIYKERGMTSHDVVFKARKILKMKKIGHSGTLDQKLSIRSVFRNKDNNRRFNRRNP